MRRYTVHVPAGARVAGVTLVPERFSWGALFLGPVWFACVGAWLPALLVAALWAACGALYPPGVAAVVVLQGLLGQDLRRWSLRRRGMAMAGVVVARGRDAALARLSRALAEAAAREGLAAEVVVTSDPREVLRADRVVLPGQGAFADCAAGVASIPGLRAAIEARVEAGAPYLGICVGMQLMAERGLEHGVTEGFGWVGGEIAPMEAPGLRLPQMGWNALDLHRPEHPLLRGIEPGEHVYFVHSYALRGHAEADVLASADYGGAVPAMVARANRAGTQFHVEKSQGVGLRILGNFLRWAP